MKKHGKAGFWGCEGDVQETSDGEFIMLHDLTTTWATGVNLTVANSTYAQLQELTITNGNNINLYSGLKIPKFEDYLRICKKFGMVPVIDSLQFQGDSSIPNFIALLDKYDLTDKCICTGLNAVGTLRKIRALTIKPVCITHTAGDWAPSSTYFVGVMNELKNAGIGTEYHYYTAEQVEILRNCNSVSMAWTIDDLDEALTCIGYGADIIVTNSLTSLFKEYKNT